MIKPGYGECVAALHTPSFDNQAKRIHSDKSCHRQHPRSRGDNAELLPLIGDTCARGTPTRCVRSHTFNLPFRWTPFAPDPGARKNKGYRT